jgi:hypothetical protein
LCQKVSVGEGWGGMSHGPNHYKTSTDKERLVTECAESQATSCDPNRTRFLTVHVV